MHNELNVVGIQADFEYCNLTRGERYYLDSPANINITNKPLSISNIGLDGVLYLLGYHDKHIDLIK